MTNWKIQYPETISLNILPKRFLGEEEAENEWNDSMKPETFFLHTDVYETFKNAESVFLFGRRGSGKTAIARMLSYEIKNQKIKDYKYVWRVDHEESYNELARNIRLSPLAILPKNELVYTLKENWEWVIYVSAMCGVCRGKNYKNNSDISPILKYLHDNNIVKEGKSIIKPFKLLSDLLTLALEEVNFETIKVALALIKITRKLVTPEFQKAKESLISVLKNEKTNCMVMIDSIERYELSDKISDAVATSLIEISLSFYTKRIKNNILVKTAFASEIYPHLNPLNKEKTEGKMLFVIWQYKNLVSLLAKRYNWYLNNSQENLNSLDNYQEARAFLYSYIPPIIISAPNIPFDTLSYIISHTQKKPRQVILLFNIILTLVQENRKIIDKITNISEDDIKKGVHARLDMLCDGAIDIYEQIYPNAKDIIMRALLRIESHFSANVLDKRLKEVKSIKRDSDLSNESVKQLFLESGIVGILNETHKFTDERNQTEGFEKYLIEGLFEYQIKGKITLNNDSKCVIHPMFFQELQVNADMDALIYAKPTEDEEKETLKYKKQKI